MVARAPDEYVAKILSVLEDPNERARLARAGRARMKSHHDWSRSMERLDGIIDRCLALRAHQSPNQGVDGVANRVRDVQRTNARSSERDTQTIQGSVER